MIRPELQDDAFLADVHGVPQSADRLDCWWLGQSGFLISWNSFYLCLDPYLSDSLTRKYQDTDKPHTRMTERVIDPARLDFVHFITSSHNHTDHLDAETLVPMLRASQSARLLVPEANRAFVCDRIGCDTALPMGVDAGESREIGPVQITAVPAAHEAIDRDAQGRCVYLGYVLRIGPFTIYHSGDTIPYEGMEDLLRPHQIDLALLPINGADPARRVAGNLDGAEAAQLAKGIGAGLVVPCHYEMFEFNTASPDLFVATCKQLGQPHRILRAGERLTLTKCEDRDAR